MPTTSFAAIFRLFALCGHWSQAKVAISAARTCQLAVVSADSAARDAARSIYCSGLGAQRALFNREKSHKNSLSMPLSVSRLTGQSSVNWICDPRKRLQRHTRDTSLMSAIKESDANNRFFNTSLIFASAIAAARGELVLGWILHIMCVRRHSYFSFIIILVPKSGRETANHFQRAYEEKFIFYTIKCQ